ncbi:MAG: hypothetical protein NZM43_07635 [Saprospiraceae bacterium]|nr:hypothetical protein [Saprospiraceae bacterium]MDW8484177.1 hypothetical protein [Saprospiraceae bacterium]
MDFSSSMQTLLKWLRRSLWALLAGALLFVMGYYFYRNYTVSDGSRTGTLVKVARQGIFFKTYEGQLHLTGSMMMSKQSVWDFSIQGSSVYQQLQQWEGRTVRCYYREKIDAFPWQGKTNFLVYKAELIE